MKKCLELLPTGPVNANDATPSVSVSVSVSVAVAHSPLESRSLFACESAVLATLEGPFARAALATMLQQRQMAHKNIFNFQRGPETIEEVLHLQQNYRSRFIAPAFRASLLQLSPRVVIRIVFGGR